ncbi:trans-Golgi network-localized SYP41-interacting protein 1 isoform X2 [Euphorbia lathyris]|uniref:trans-Golgi network-localized SYP41-interacting protein 1 isoform X2 n=1 Tax=Euphorbia lathyris TaxID=212925 RepID=UPI0033130A7B
MSETERNESVEESLQNGDHMEQEVEEKKEEEEEEEAGEEAEEEEEEESNGPIDPESSINQESEPGVDSNHVESKEEMFVDAADDIEDNQFQEMDNGDIQADTNLGDQDTISNENKEEKEDLVEEVADLLQQLRDLTNKQSLPGDDNGDSKEEPVGASLSEMIKECSQCVKVSLEERLQTENMIRELRDLTNKQSLPGDDNEDSKGKPVRASLSEMINECSQRVKVSLEEQLQSERTIRELQQQIEDLNVKVQVEHSVDVFADRILGSLSTVVNQELFDYSVVGKIAHVEKGTSLLMEQYRWFLYEADQLRQCLFEGGFNVGGQEEFGYDKVFGVARGELLELKKTEAEMSNKLSHFEDINRKLVEEVEKEKAMAATAVLELEKVKVELDQEKNRCANTKEKLSMAVTKGKALVQQRDSLKQSLAEKTSELEKSLVELQEKSNAVEAAERCRGELAKCENSVASLQEMLSQKNIVLESCESVISKISVPEELLSTGIEHRLQWLVDLVASLQETLLQKNAIFENLDAIFSQISISDEIESTDIIGRLKWLVYSVASLQEILSQRNQILHSLEEILSHTSLPAELESADTVEKFRWTVEERNALKSNLLEFHRLKDALSLLDLPETVSSSDLETRISWLKASVDQAKGEIIMFQDEIARTKDAAQKEMEQLNAALLAEVQEKEYLKMQLGDLAQKYEMVAQQAHQASSEKDQMVRLLLEGAEIQDANSDVATLVERCFGKIKEQNSASFDASRADLEEFQKMQSLLYLRVQDLMVCEKLLEEDELVRSQVRNLSNELSTASAELGALKVEKDALQNALQRSEDKSLLLKEKLSLAVKKGKGLVQDRENLKLTLDEKNSEIEKLKIELRQQESTISEWRDQINKLSIDLEQVPKLEADLADVKNQKDQFEQFLLESNNMLQKVIEAVDHIVLPVDSSFEDPVEKVNWIAVYVNECQQAKSYAEQELKEAREETNLLAGKLAEAELSINSLEDAFSDAQNRISQLEDALSGVQHQVSQLSDEKRAVELAKENIELDLQKLNEEVQTQTSKFMEACANRKMLEDALTLAESNISLHVGEREEAQLSRAATEAELEKVREEVAVQTDKLTEAYMTIKSLEDTLSRAEANISMLSEQNNSVHDGRTSLESELKKLKEEAELQAIRAEDASTTIKSLEDALSKTGNDISVLEEEKRIAEQEISGLNSKLKACMDELAGTTGSLENRSSELIHHIGDLQMLMKNVSLVSMIRQHFEKKFENLRNMDLILKEMKDYFVDTAMEEDSHLTEPFPYELGNIVNIEMEDDDVNAADVDKISLSFKKIVEGFQLRDRTLMDNIVGFSTFTDKFAEALLGKLRATKDEVTVIFEHMESVKQEMKNMEMQKEEQGKTISLLERYCEVLLSACTNATGKLQFEVKNKLLELSSIPELVKLNDSMIPEAEYVNSDEIKPQQSLDDSRYDKVAESLLLATRKTQNILKQFEGTSNAAAATIEDLQKKLGEVTEAYENSIEERGVVQMRVTELEKDLEALENSCKEMRLKTGDYQAVEEKLKEKDAEISSLHHNQSLRDQDALMSTSELKTLFNKIREIESSYGESVENMESHSSSHVQKLFYIIDNIPNLHFQIDVLSNDKEKLQSTLSLQALEIENLEQEMEKQMRNNEESEKIKSEMSELTLGLEKLREIIGDVEVVEDQKSAGVQRLLPIVEKRISALLLEAQNSSSRAQELGTRLLESQKIVEELSAKVKLLDGTSCNKTVETEIVQERSIFEAPSLPTGSEISEIEDVGPVGKNATAALPVPSAAQLRTMRKGSTDHLVLNVDSESASLINHEEKDEDKGHVFKSLNTSGLIPKQGKSVADRVDGIWVSGGRVLMNRPRARLGFIAYWLLLHMWLLATIV